MRLLSLALLAGALGAVASPATAQIPTRAELAAMRVRIQSDSCDPDLYFLLGRTLAFYQQWDAADSSLQQAVALNPQNAAAWLAAATVQNANRRYWERLRRIGAESEEREHRRRNEMVRRSLALDPLLSPADAHVGERASSGESFAYLDLVRTAALRRYGPLDSVGPGLLWTHARAAARDFRYPVAIADVQALVRVASAREQRGLTEVAPFRLADFQYLLADLFHLAGDRATATRLYHDVLAADISMFMAHVQLARIAEADGDTVRAIRERRAAAEANPDDHTLLLDLGVALQHAGRPAEAEEAFRQARSLQARDPWVHYRLGVFLDERGRRQEAVASLETFVAIAPAAWTAPLADARQRLGRVP